MEYQSTSKGEHYNLRWNNYTTNLIQVFSEHQHHETLVDVTLTCEGQFIKAHKLILSACSGFFQDMFKMHGSVQHPFIILNGIKFNHLKHILEFIYHGEIKILDTDLEGVLTLGESFQVKGLSSVKLKHQITPQNESRSASLKCTSTDPTYSATNSLQDATVSPQKENSRSSSTTMMDCSKDKLNRGPRRSQINNNRSEPDGFKNAQSNISLQNIKEVETRKRPRTEQIHRAIHDSVGYENNKGISVRLGNMWKSLSSETKESYYLAARRAQREHEMKYPGYTYKPRDASKKKAVRRKTIDSVAQFASVDIQEYEEDEDIDDLQIIEINEDPIDISNISDSSQQFY
ncbi:hypothetical protein NQ314_020463 [Rhamnusium bicolor]|uniref:Uncharacterized protein n=1 Tax=Rhamnusium bicolor TaxID=1586634 RepID=A0AAV8WLM5_9CUCU|nr:hypothetical protein NQ314_020463 [Rhamnusium bicolor]